MSLYLWEDGFYEERVDLMRAFAGWDRVEIRKLDVSDAQAAADLAAYLAAWRAVGVELPPNPPQPSASDLWDSDVEDVPDPPASREEEEEDQAHA